MTRAVTLAPIFHLTICYIYLYFVYLGFGGQIAQFSTISDVFRIGIAKIASIYGLSLIVYLLGHLWMDAQPFKLAPGEIRSIHPSLKSSRHFFILLALMPIALIVIEVLKLFSSAEVSVIVMCYPIAVFAIWVNAKIFENNDFNQTWKLPIGSALSAVILIAAMAYGDGFKLRHKPYSYFGDYPDVCGKGKLLLIQDEIFTVVMKDNSRVYLDHKCNSVANLIEMKVLIDVN